MPTKLEHIRELNAQAWGLCKKDAPRALELARQAESLLADCAEAVQADQFECLKTQTYCLDVLSKPEQALPVAMRADRLAEAIGDTYLIGSIQSLLGRIYWHIDDFPTAMDYYVKALELVRAGNYPDLEVTLINGLGLVQYGLANYDEALGYFKTCLEKAGEDDLTGRADANNNIAYVLHVLGRDAEALPYGLAGLDLFNRLGTVVGKMETLHSLGAIHFALGDYEQAMACFQEGIGLSRQNDSRLLELAYVMEIGRIHLVQGRPGQAEQEMLLALEAARKINSLNYLAQIHERLVEIYKAKGDYQSALAHSEAFHVTDKQVFNDQSDRRLKNLEVQHQVESTRKQADLYRELAGTDFLTGLVNRRRFLEMAETACRRANREGSPLAAMMLDIDHFKEVNDRHGHKTGDEVLSAVAAAITKSLRPGDVLGRYGGEEFVALVTGNPREQCLKIAERIRAAVGAQQVPVEGEALRVTVSLGLAWADAGHAPPLEELIERADRAMYLAKQAGRNRVAVWEG